jgi:NAD(P)-dependent dehydrogenase (short-subunit alcohol dehydrogenase family)
MTVLIIGAGGTIGRACVEEILKDAQLKSKKIIAADLKIPSIPNIEAVELDVTKMNQVRDVINNIERDSPITGVIYAAGLNTTGPIDSIDWSDYERVMAVNLKGAFHIGAVLLNILRKNSRTFASVFVSSTAGLLGEAGGSIYCASKFGLIGFTQSFAGEVAAFGGRANVICPGNVDSPMLTTLAERIGTRQGLSGDDVLNQWIGTSAFKRLITPKEVAETCAWLLSQLSSGVSGQTIVVDGARA